jgi:hypothetical protein
MKTINLHKLLMFCFLSFISTAYCFAGCDADISDYVGWQIIYSGTVTGYIDEDGNEVYVVKTF